MNNRRFRRQQQRIHSAVRQIVSIATVKCKDWGSEAWANRLFVRKEIDGYVVVSPTHAMPFLKMEQNISPDELIAYGISVCKQRGHGVPQKVVVRGTDGKRVVCTTSEVGK